MAYQLTCAICGVSFTHCFSHTQCCSEKCRKIREIKRSGRGSLDKSLPSGTVGAISELSIASELMKKGYAVFRALSPACFCDLIAIKESVFLKIDVTTGYKNEATGKIVHCKNPSFCKRKGIGVVGVYIRSTTECLFFDSEGDSIEI